MTAAAKTSSSVEPPTVQGGVIGAADTATPSGSAAASSTAKASAAESIWSTIARPWVLFLVLLGWLLRF